MCQGGPEVFKRVTADLMGISRGITWGFATPSRSQERLRRSETNLRVFQGVLRGSREVLRGFMSVLVGLREVPRDLRAFKRVLGCLKDAQWFSGGSVKIPGNVKGISRGTRGLQGVPCLKAN